MSQINRPPLGLQQLLGSQNFGQNPRELAQTVQPTIDLFPFFGSGLLRVAEATGGRGDEGLICNVEFFGRVAVVSMSAHYQAGSTAVELIGFGFALSELAGDTPSDETYLKTWVPESWAATSHCTWGYTLPYPLLLESGAKLGAYYTSFAGAADSLKLRVLYYDLEPGGAS